MFEQTSQSQSTSSSCAHTVDSRIGAFGVLDGVSLSLDIAFFDRCQLASLLTPIFDVQLGSDSPLLKLPCFDKYFTMTDSLLVVDIVPSKENSNGTTCRPVTRQYLKKERQKAQKSENLELRRSNRDHNVSPFIGASSESKIPGTPPSVADRDPHFIFHVADTCQGWDSLLSTTTYIVL